MRKNSVYRSLHRPILTLGAERDPVQLVAFICFLVGFGGMTTIAVTTAVIVWFSALYCLQRMAKADLYMCRIFSRHTQQQDFYAAHSTAWRKS